MLIIKCVICYATIQNIRPYFKKICIKFFFSKLSKNRTLEPCNKKSNFVDPFYLPKGYLKPLLYFSKKKKFFRTDC